IKTPKVIERLCFAFPKWIYRYPHSRREIASKAIPGALAVDRRTIDALLLVTPADERRHKAIDAPGVLQISGIIMAVCVKPHSAKFGATQLQRHAGFRAIRPRQNWAERARVGLKPQVPVGVELLTNIDGRQLYRSICIGGGNFGLRSTATA